MNFENQIIDFKPKPLFENKELQKELLKKKYQLVDQYRPEESSFTDIYSKEEIDADLAEIESIKKSWGNENENLKNVSSIYEGVIADQISANAWFGDNCESTPASVYDDIKNGIDVVSIFKQENIKQYIGLSIDVTFASDTQIPEKRLESIKVIEKKLKSIELCIWNRSLPSLKYFQDPDTGEHKKIFLPKIIIGCQLSSAEELIQLWGSKDPEKNKKLAQHPISSKIIMESLAQLQYFYKYAKNLAENHTDIKDKEAYESIAFEYAKMYNIFFDIYQNKKELIESHLNEISEDIVYQTIKKYTERKI